jgi:hypothetical protein
MRRLVYLIAVVVSASLFSAYSNAQQSLSSVSPKERLKLKGICNSTAGERTYRISIDNQTDWGIVIAFVQAKDESNNVPSGFVSDTGTFVLATNADSHTVVAQDPCYAGGFERPIQATRCLGSVKLTDGSNEVDVNLEDITDGDLNTFYGECNWHLVESAITKKPVAANPKMPKKK